MTYQIRINSSSQVYRVETEEALTKGQNILVSVDQILESAVVLCQKCPKHDSATLPEAVFMRVLTVEDQALKTKLKEKAKVYIDQVQAKAARHNLDIKIIDTDLSFDEKKLTIHFSAENRVDFRSLVSDVMGNFRKIIRMQQVGPREEAKLMGGVGRCGQEICCHRFLKDTEAVAAEMASMQEFSSKTVAKMTGCCGRAMCCLLYEAKQ